MAMEPATSKKFLHHQNRDDMKSLLEANGYFNIRHVDGGWIANLRLLYTTALCIDLDEWGYESRYCYGDKFLAERACNELKSIDDEPLPGYVAKRVR